MNIFKDWKSLADQFPGPAEMANQENEMQYPHAKFIVAGLEDEDSDDPTISMFFDVGLEDQVLWIWVAGDLEDETPNRGSYIDEYYLMPAREAEYFHGNIYNERSK